MKITTKKKCIFTRAKACHGLTTEICSYDHNYTSIFYRYLSKTYKMHSKTQRVSTIKLHLDLV
jgi:hypothetical protein